MTGDIIFRLAVRSVRVHLLRSVLAALGIVIGVIAIAAMGMLGANMTLTATAQLSSMGNILVVRPHMEGGGFGPGGGGGSTTTEEVLTDLQFRDLERAAGKYGLVYHLHSTSDTITSGSESRRASIYGMETEDIQEVLEVETGDFPKSTNDIIVGPTLAERLGLSIGGRVKIGKEATGQHTVRVVGILKQRGLSMDLNSDQAVLMADKLYTSLYGGEGEYDQATVVLENIEDATAAKEAIENQMNKREEVVSVQDSSRMLETITSTLATMTAFVMSIAGISLLVAAVSIFNVMMMSVTERIGEIGVLRSIGTQKTEVRRMFLYEAAILGVVGAVIGAILSLAIGYLVVLAMIGGTDYFFAPGSLLYIPMAMVVGITICVVSGVYPAWRASDLEPIEALRAE